MSTFEIRRGTERGRTRTDWLDSWHSFAFGPYYDPDNLGFGALIGHNEDVLQPGPGYPAHGHLDIEILTWVLTGSLTHQDGAGRTTVIESGQLHCISSGSGIRHTEYSTSADQPVRLVQMWLRPDEFGLPPRCQHLAPDDRLRAGGLVPLASGEQRQVAAGALPIRRRGATLWAARLPAGEPLSLPAAGFLHVFLTRGAVQAQPTSTLVAGDALRITGGGGHLWATEPAEVLVWQLRDGAAAALPG